ncbi:MAG TPA: hypothetical protein VFT16_01675 [Candidatus Saccharimonadales bacterium]|nr:hypothetical protein [Candidatus Saccharimonadales bacterium]
MECLRASGASERGVFRMGAALLSGALAIAACGHGGESTEVPSPAQSYATTDAARTGLGPRPKDGPMLVFDDLHGGSSIIQVYPGVTTSTADRQPNGEFRDDESIPATCKTQGRQVHSVPALGEDDRTSNVWIRIDGSPREVQYATAVYVEDPEALLDRLPDC